MLVKKVGMLKSACHGRNYLVSLWLLIDGPETDTVWDGPDMDSVWDMLVASSQLLPASDDRRNQTPDYPIKRCCCSHSTI